MKTNLKTLMLALAVSGTFFSCSNEEEVIGVPQPTKQLSFTASNGTDGQSASASGRKETKLVDGNKVEFVANDSISVIVNTINVPFTTAQEGSTVTFNGSVAATAKEYYALYPYQQSASYNPLTGLTVELPIAQYAVGSGTYDPKAALSVAYTTDEVRIFNFKNVTSMVKFQLQGEAARIVLKSNSTQDKIAGRGSINPAQLKSETPQLPTGTSDSIVLKPILGTATIPAGVYYINVRPGTYTSGLKLSAYPTAVSATASGELDLTPVTLNRSKILNVGTLVAETGPEYVEIAGVKWATMNIGATSVADSWETCRGDFYQWGSVNTIYNSIVYQSSTQKEKFDFKVGTYGFIWNNCEWKANYDLGDEQDVVTKTYGAGWRMPSYADYRATIAACGGNPDSSNTPTVTTDKNVSAKGIYWFDNYNNGVSGILLCDGEGHRLFFPASGYGHNADYLYKGESAGYWTREIYNTDNTAAIYLGLSKFQTTTQTSHYKREYGWNVRGVKK